MNETNNKTIPYELLSHEETEKIKDFFKSLMKMKTHHTKTYGTQ